MAKVPSFKLNPNENKFAPVLEYFLRRQLHLKGNLHVIDKLKSTWNISMGSPLTIGDTTVLYDELFRFRYEDESDLSLLKTYLLNGFVAQYVENFETYLRNLFEKILELRLDGNVSKKLNRRMFGTNRELIDIIKTYLLPIKNYAELTRIEPVFFMLESVRHVVVHSDQVVKNGIDVSNTSIFKKYFSTKDIKGELRLMIDVGNAEVLNAEIAQFGFEFFRLLSDKHGYPIRIDNN